MVKELCYKSEGPWFDSQSAVSSGRVRSICSERAACEECCFCVSCISLFIYFVK